MVLLIAARFTNASFHFDELGSSVITPALLCNVVLMFVICGGQLAFLAAEFNLFTFELASTNQAQFFHMVSQNGLLNCSKRTF